MTLCDDCIKRGSINRYIITIIYFGILLYNVNNKYINKYFLLLSAWLFAVLDGADRRGFIPEYNVNDHFGTSFYYNYLDKICDSVSYLLFFIMFKNKLNYLLLFFILYRIIGVILYGFIKNRAVFVLFFDFIKEFLIYMFIFGKNYKYLPIFILGKIVFEYNFHVLDRFRKEPI